MKKASIVFKFFLEVGFSFILIKLLICKKFSGIPTFRSKILWNCGIPQKKMFGWNFTHSWELNLFFHLFLFWDFYLFDIRAPYMGTLLGRKSFQSFSSDVLRTNSIHVYLNMEKGNDQFDVRLGRSVCLSTRLKKIRREWKWIYNFKMYHAWNHKFTNSY